MNFTFVLHTSKQTKCQSTSSLRVAGRTDYFCIHIIQVHLIQFLNLYTFACCKLQKGHSLSIYPGAIYFLWILLNIYSVGFMYTCIFVVVGRLKYLRHVIHIKDMACAQWLSTHCAHAKSLAYVMNILKTSR